MHGVVSSNTMMLSVFINGIISAEILFIFVYLLIFLTLIGYEIFFALSRFLFTERLHYTRMVLAFILKGFLQRNGHMVEKHLEGWLVRTTINLFL